MDALHRIGCLLVGLGLSGCGSDFVVAGSPRPPDGGSCEFGVDAGLADEVVLDLGASFTLRVPFVVEAPAGEALTPERFDMRWECRDLGFALDLGPMILPAFSTASPFCLDNRSDAEGQFVGFDILPATGARIEAGERGLAFVEAVPQILGDAIDELIQAAKLAEQCLEEDDVECSAVTELVGPMEPARIRGFARLDGNHADQAILERGSTPPELSGTYPLRLVGILEAALDDGTKVTSNQISLNVGVCKNCGRRTAEGREPREGYECYR